jgi:hypothetical protein
VPRTQFLCCDVAYRGIGAHGIHNEIGGGCFAAVLKNDTGSTAVHDLGRPRGGLEGHACRDRRIEQEIEQRDALDGDPLAGLPVADFQDGRVGVGKLAVHPVDERPASLHLIEKAHMSQNGRAGGLQDEAGADWLRRHHLVVYDHVRTLTGKHGGERAPAHACAGNGNTKLSSFTSPTARWL